MSRLPITVLSLVFLATCSISASDWPAYRHDARRSATSVDQLEFPLRLSWHRQSTLAPRPAFDDPVKHPSGIDFTYVRDYSEPVLLDFDHTFHPIAAKGRVYFGSSADDSVRCLSLANGKEQWAFVTGGPVRFAPQVVGNRLYVASDDGFVYCLKSTSGDLIWKFRAAPSARQLVGNGRMISRWPLRTGILVQDNTVYTTAGMWPAEGVFVYALDAQTGDVKWKNDTSGTLNQPTASRGAYAITGIAPTGYLLAGPQALVVPTGRSIPASYSLRDGRLLASVAPSYQNRRGGPAVCIDPHGSVIFGYPRERLTGKDYSVHYVHQLPNMTQFGTIRADRFIADDRSFVATRDLIRCYEANSRYTKVKVVWQHDCPSRNLRCLALSANALLLGSDNQVTARDRKTGEILWRHGKLDGYVQSIAVADEKLLVATDAGSIYCFSPTAGSQPQGGLPAISKPLNIKPSPPGTANPALSLLLKEEHIKRGMALVLGHRDTTLASQLAAETQLQVVLLLDDKDAVSEARNVLLRKVQPTGGHVSVQVHDRSTPLPFADYAFNLITTTSDVTVERTAELHRVLCPAGGVLYVDQATAEAKQVLSPFTLHKGPDPSSPAVAAGRLTTRDNASLIYHRGKLAGALDWDSETNTDQRVKWPLELLWFGGPGSKRTGQGSRPPVAAGGRDFVIGKNHLMALDAYNGTELWSRTLPYLYRNIGRLRNAPGPINPWLAQSVSADDDHVYLNLGHLVYTLDANSGQQQAIHGKPLPSSAFHLQDEPRFSLDHFQRPDARGVSSTTTRSASPAGSITLREHPFNDTLHMTLQLAADVEITDKVYWELFFDIRQPQQRVNLYEKGIFHLLVRPSTGSVETGIGAVHPNVTVITQKAGRRMLVTLRLDELAKLGNRSLDDFCFAAALNHPAGEKQKAMAGGRAYLRWEVHCDSLAYALNNGWAQI
ncbi:MAG: PQQ-binding-like beta-propeller repeat protein, partial [Pirellulaceae bacterium]